MVYGNDGNDGNGGYHGVEEGRLGDGGAKSVLGGSEAGRLRSFSRLLMQILSDQHKDTPVTSSIFGEGWTCIVIMLRATFQSMRDPVSLQNIKLMSKCF